MRILTRSLFLAAALVAALVLRHLPELLALDQFRPRVINLLERSFHCQANVGRIRGSLFPRPGLVVSQVTLLQYNFGPGTHGRILAAVGAVRLSLSVGSWRGPLRFDTIRFSRPRFFIYRDAPEQFHLLRLPGAGPSIGPAQNPANLPVRTLEIRNGLIELRDHAGTVHRVWTAENIGGTFRLQEQTGSLSGRLPSLGRHAILDLHYRGWSAFPLDMQLNRVNFKALMILAGAPPSPVEGVTDFILRVRASPTLKLQAIMKPVRMPAFPKSFFRGHLELDQDALKASLATGDAGAMSIDIDGHFARAAVLWKAAVNHYDSTLVRAFYRQAWVDRLTGDGALTAAVERKPRTGWAWSLEGRHFRLATTTRTVISIPEWSADGDRSHLVVYAQAMTPTGGVAQVDWSAPLPVTQSALEVDVSSMTIGEVLEACGVARSSAAYERWMISQGSVGGELQSGVFLLNDSDLDVAGMHWDVSGTFERPSASGKAHIEGDVLHAPVPAVVQTFLAGSSPLTGSGQADFAFDFPLTHEWYRGLSGSCNVTIQNGVLRMLKTAYRIASVLNLGNYLRARLPRVSAEGILFQQIQGHLRFRNGVIYTDDLFLKSPDMNVGAKGSVDLSARRVNATVRVELFRFLEDVLRRAPITHWIFKKPNKIFLPLVVQLTGPWNDVDVH